MTEVENSKQYDVEQGEDAESRQQLLIDEGTEFMRICGSIAEKAK